MPKQLSDRAHLIPLRIAVLDPFPGVALQIQRGKSGLLPPSRLTPKAAYFELEIRVEFPISGDRPNFLGEFAQGPREARFIYLNSGARAGQLDSCWDRRAKVPLGTITASQVHELLADNTKRLEARLNGLSRDGGPLCATVPLLGGRWQVVPTD